MKRAMWFYKCNDSECESVFAVDFGTSCVCDVVCAGCGGDDWSDIGKLEVEVPMDGADHLEC